MHGPARAVSILVGLPPPVRQLVERRVASNIRVRPILLKRDGGFMLEPPNTVAAAMIERFAAEDVEAFDRVLIVILPYMNSRLPDEVARSIETLESLGAKTARPQSGKPPWPPRVPRMDNAFQTDLATALAQLVNSTFPLDALPDEHLLVCIELLRGLASHSKMGPNNHSHEDDLWKSRGQDLGPGERDQILSYLLREGYIGRKKNKSAGGTGWVYWIADVQRARSSFPELEPYFN